MNIADVNECSEDNGGCGEKCENGLGNFSCSCTSGYNLDADGVTCNGMITAWLSCYIPYTGKIWQVLYLSYRYVRNR